MEEFPSQLFSLITLLNDVMYVEGGGLGGPGTVKIDSQALEWKLRVNRIDERFWPDIDALLYAMMGVYRGGSTAITMVDEDFSSLREMRDG